MLVDRLGLDPSVPRQHEYYVGQIRVVSNAQGFLGFMATVVGGCCYPQSTVTFGSDLIVSSGEIKKGSPLLAHELGHVNQARQLGLFYLPAYVAAIPGTIYEHGFNFHDFHPAEENANARAGLLPNGLPPPGWEYPWLIGR